MPLSPNVHGSETTTGLRKLRPDCVSNPRTLALPTYTRRPIKGPKMGPKRDPKCTKTYKTQSMKKHVPALGFGKSDPFLVIFGDPFCEYKSPGPQHLLHPVALIPSDFWDQSHCPAIDSWYKSPGSQPLRHTVALPCKRFLGPVALTPSDSW